MAEKQTTYSWEGVNAQGAPAKGEIAAASPALAQAELKRRGIIVNKIAKKPSSILDISFGEKKQKITSVDILLFTRQLATMLTAGLPMVKAFEIVGSGNENPSMEQLILSMKNDISAGNTLAETLAKYPKYFDTLFCSLINAGERSGTLDTMLNRIATYLEKTQTLKKKVKKASIYPIVIFSAAMLAGGVLLIFVVPRFQGMFKSFGADLPAFTQMVVNLSDFLQAYWWIILGLMVVSIIGFKTAKKRSPAFAYNVDKYTLKAPIIGPISKKVILARFTRTLATTMSAGMPVIDAFECVNNVIENRVYKAAFIKVREDVAAGQPISSSLEATGLCPVLVTKMISVGEESGTLESMLNKVASYYEEEVDSIVDNLSSLLEPLIMIVLGVIIGGFVIAMYLPIFKMGSVM